MVARWGRDGESVLYDFVWGNVLLHSKSTGRVGDPPLREKSGEVCVILSEQSESKNLPIYGLRIRNDRKKILRLASLAQDDILN